MGVGAGKVLGEGGDRGVGVCRECGHASWAARKRTSIEGVGTPGRWGMWLWTGLSVGLTLGAWKLGGGGQ